MRLPALAVVRSKPRITLPTAATPEGHLVAPTGSAGDARSALTSSRSSAVGGAQLYRQPVSSGSAGAFQPVQPRLQHGDRAAQHLALPLGMSNSFRAFAATVALLLLSVLLISISFSRSP